ncbi:unnamed protein product [Effrenium voratum]|nr:unnamed protein product [Effrenium voratum]
MATDSEQIEDWADEIYASLGKETTWSISQVRCPEEGCPPVETVITDLSVKAPRPGAGVYKILKPFEEVTKEDVEHALSDQGHGHGGHGTHGSAHGGHGGHEAHGDCCGDHGGDGHGHEGHGTHGSAHSGHGGHGGHEAHGDCCEDHGGDGHGHEGHGHGSLAICLAQVNSTGLTCHKERGTVNGDDIYTTRHS